jgi:hypothetical protein
VTISMSNVGLEGLAVVVVGIESRNFVEHALLATVLQR